MPGIGLDEEQLRVLKETSSIGAENAACSLSIMLNKNVAITTLDVVVASLGEIPQILGAENEPVNAVYFSLNGKISGTILMVIPISESLQLANALIQRKPSGNKDLDEDGVSALKELGNIITGAYVTSFADDLHLKIMYSIPEFASGTLGTIMDGIPAIVPLKSEPVVIVKNEFTAGEDTYGTHLIFIPDIKSLAMILHGLGVLERQGK